MLRNFAKLFLKYPIKIANNSYSKYVYKEYKKRDKYESSLEDNLARVLVFAPHVDDETIGMGGTLIQLRKVAKRMVLVYITDGSGATSDLDDMKLIQERKDEGQKISDLYGFDKVIFMDEKDGEVCSTHENFVNSLKEIIESNDPDRIYSPFLVDGHRDHVETTKGVLFACEKLGREFDIYGYQVNCPILPELINQVLPLEDEIILKKEEAYRIFKSQYVMGFSAFKLIEKRQGEVINNKGPVEVFVKASSTNYSKMVKVLKNEGFYPEEFKQISSEYNLIPALKISRDKKNKYTKKILEIIG